MPRKEKQMRKLLRHEFEADPEIDSAREGMLRAGDELFAEVMASAGAMKKWALRQFEAHNAKVKAFMERHHGYYVAKRRHVIEMAMLNHGAKETTGEEVNISRGKGARAMGIALMALFLLQGCAMAAQANCKDPRLTPELQKACAEMSQACIEIGCSVSLRGGA